MTVTSSLMRSGPYLADGVNTSFGFTFKIKDADDLRVVVADDAVGTNSASYSTGYTIDDQWLNRDAGGTVEFLIDGDPVEAGKYVWVLGNAAYEQGVEFTRQGPYNPLTVMDALDRLAIQTKQIAETVTRMPVASPGVPVPSIADIVSAAASAIAAAASAAAADLSEAAAAASAAAALASANASGTAIYYDTYAAANAAVGGLPDQQLVEVLVDETKTNARTRYRKSGGVLVFKLRFPGMSDLNARSITEFGAVSGVDCTAAMNAAAAACKRRYIPAGEWSWTGQIEADFTSEGVWIIDPAATFPNADTVGPLNVVELALGGRIAWMEGRYGTGWRFGSASAWSELVRPFAIPLSEHTVISPSGGICYFGASRSSDNLPANFNTIPFFSISYNDNETNREPVWGAYLEVIREPGAGRALGIEIDTVNYGTTYPWTPYSTGSISSQESIPLWIASGAEQPSATESSAAMVILNNGARFQRGIVINSDAINTTIREAICMPHDIRFGWNGGDNLNQTYISGDDARLGIRSDTVGYREEFRRRRADGVTATANTDEAGRTLYRGWDGTDFYNLAFVQSLQRSNFSGGNARGSYDINARNTDGTYSQVTLNGLANKALSFFPDNDISLGSASGRASVVYAGTGTINTSDATLKTDIRGLDAAEKAVAARCKSLFKAYRWKDAVAEKGDDARIHFGVIAQEVAAAFEAEGLDPWRYGVMCKDELIEPRTVSVPVSRQKIEVVTIEDELIEVVDGVAVKRKVSRETERPAFETLMMYDADGNQIMQPVYEKYVKTEVIDGKKVNTVARRQVGEKPATYMNPVMEDYLDERQEMHKTGKFRLGVRYTELFAFILAGEA